MSLFFVDCEAYGNVPALGALTEFGVVHWPTRKSFHGILVKSEPDPANPAAPLPVKDVEPDYTVWPRCERFLSECAGRDRAVMVSDNPAFDFMWIADGFWRHLGRNPFGHSARRISDFYAGLTGDFHNTQKWKRLRITPHDHNPVHDALGNVEAFDRMLKGER